MRTLLAGCRVEVPALTPAGHALELRSLRGPDWPASWHPAKDQSLRTEWAYIRRFARGGGPVLPAAALARDAGTDRCSVRLRLPRGASRHSVAPPPVTPNPCLHPRRLLPLPPFGQSSGSRCSAERRGDALAPVPRVVAPPLAGPSCRPSLRVAALSRWGGVSWPASSMKSLRKETLSEMLVSASRKQ